MADHFGSRFGEILCFVYDHKRIGHAYPRRDGWSGQQGRSERTRGIKVCFAGNLNVQTRGERSPPLAQTPSEAIQSHSSMTPIDLPDPTKSGIKPPPGSMHERQCKHPFMGFQRTYRSLALDLLHQAVRLTRTGGPTVCGNRHGLNTSFGIPSSADC